MFTKETYENKILSPPLAKAVLQKKFLQDFGENRIESRLSYFAQDVLVDPKSIHNVLGGDPRDLAFALHCVCGLPVSVSNLMVWDAFSVHDLRNDLFENLRAYILAVGERCKQNSRVRLTSTDVTISGGGQITRRMAAREIIS